MLIDHIAIWTSDIERLKDYYVRFFNGVPNSKYINEKKRFESYFITFGTGARLEIMRREGIPEHINDQEGVHYAGLTHIAFGALTAEEVDKKAEQLTGAGYPIHSGPRVTGDGYYEFETSNPDGNRVEVSFETGSGN